MATPPPLPRKEHRHGQELRPGDETAMSGERVPFRQLPVPTSIGLAIVTASGPRRVALARLREAMVPLLGLLEQAR